MWEPLQMLLWGDLMAWSGGRFWPILKPPGPLPDPGPSSIWLTNSHSLPAGGAAPQQRHLRGSYLSGLKLHEFYQQWGEGPVVLMWLVVSLLKCLHALTSVLLFRAGERWTAELRQHQRDHGRVQGVGPVHKWVSLHPTGRSTCSWLRWRDEEIVYSGVCWISQWTGGTGINVGLWLNSFCIVLQLLAEGHLHNINLHIYINMKTLKVLCEQCHLSVIWGASRVWQSEKCLIRVHEEAPDVLNVWKQSV